MPIVQNFTVSQSISTPNICTVTDTSTGTDDTLTSRRVYLQKADGTYLVPDGTTTDYILWAIGDTSIAINAIDIDYALSTRVDWMVSNTVAYTKTTLYEFQAYAIIYMSTLIKAVASRPAFFNSQNFLTTLFNLYVYMQAASDAVVLMNDITNAQLNNSKAKFIIDNPQLAY